MRVIVLWADPKSPNLGSQMIAEGISTFLRDHSISSDIQFISHNQLQDICRARWYSIKGISRIRKYLKSCDLVIDMGDGDSFTSQYGMNRFLKLSALRIIVRLNSKKIILGPQSIGVSTGIKSMIARFSLYGVSAVVVRDSESMKALALIYNGPSAIATDTSWGIKSTVLKGNRKRMCLINLNGLFFSLDEPIRRKAFQKSLQNLALVLVQRNYIFDFMYHVATNTGADNDRLWETYITNEFSESKIFSPENFVEARRILGEYEFSVGSRYHFCLNSLQAGTPCIPISYGTKFDSIYQNIPNINDWGTEISIGDWEGMIDKYSTLDLRENSEMQLKLLQEFANLYTTICVSE